MVARPEITGRRPRRLITGSDEELGEEEEATGSVAEFCARYKISIELYRSLRARVVRALPAGPGDAFTVAEFCRRHRISVQFYYQLKKENRAPDEVRLGSRVIITRESAERWRAAREADTKAEAAATAPSAA
jgi:phage terminase small subunit